MVLAGALAFAGIPATNVQAAVADRCDGDYQLVTNESLAQQRKLAPDETIVGEITLFSTDADRTLHIDLRTDNRELDYHVFMEDGNCETFADNNPNCEGEITSKSAASDTECVLEAPDSGSRTYFVNKWNNGTKDLKFKAWAE